VRSISSRISKLRTNPLPRIKKAYRKKALELHPDRNYGDVENATIKFAEVQSAYQVLSDPQERAWYDSHRDSILRGDSGGPSDEDQYEHKVHITSARDIVGLISRFNPRMPFTDAPVGFYGILQDAFAKLANEEDAACDWEGFEPVEYPDFGSSTDDYEDAVKPFYRVWMNFSTQKTFSWRDEYRASDAPDRATRRLIEKENKRLRDEGIREFNDAVRALVAFVRKRDPRFIPNSQTEADRQKILREAAAAQAARSRAANKAKFDKHVVPDWAKTNPPEEEAEFTDSEESEVEHIECVVCSKTFKSEKQYETHEKSKKHIKAVQQLKREMKKENKRLNLDNSSDESLTPADEFENLAVTKEEPNTDEPSSSPGKANGGETGPSNPVIDSEPGQDLGHDHKETEVSSDESPESDDEYAPRQDVEGRLASTLLGSDDVKNIQTEESTPTTATSIASDNDSKKLPKLGKAKAKRAKKAARQEADTQGSTKVSSIHYGHCDILKYIVYMRCVQQRVFFED
jgi:DnaJ family protein A protein 5